MTAATPARHPLQPPEERFPELRGKIREADRLAPPIEGTDARYRLGPGDLVQVLAPRGPALLRVRIDPEGGSTRLGGLPVEVNWSGRTLAEVKAEIRSRFPTLSGARVHVRPHFECPPDAHRVGVIGEAAVEIPWSPGLRLVAALDAAGLIPQAADREVWIVRRGDETFIHCNLWAFFSSADTRHDPPLEPTDFVVVAPAHEADDATWRLMLDLMAETQPR
jgi:protein involved in polysaccharide export with SLBB domain